jgi:hypothetical protein
MLAYKAISYLGLLAFVIQLSPQNLLLIFQELERYRQVAERRRRFQNDTDDM